MVGHHIEHRHNGAQGIISCAAGGKLADEASFPFPGAAYNYGKECSKGIKDASSGYTKVYEAPDPTAESEHAKVE